MNTSKLITPVEFSKQEIAIFNHVARHKLTMVSPERLIATMRACKYVVDNKIEGDFVECGVWRGGNALAAAAVFKLYGVAKRVFLFDTFAGMTPPTEDDRPLLGGEMPTETHKKNQRDTHNDWCYASLEDVRANFSAAGLLTDAIVFVQGDVLETLTDAQNLPSAISVLRLDTDWYKSTKAEMDVLYPLLTTSGVLMIDDYGHWDGSRRAVEDYFAAHPPKPFLQAIDYSGRCGVKL